MAESRRSERLITVTFNERGPLYIDFKPLDGSIGAVFVNFRKTETGDMSAAEREGALMPGDVLSQMNNEDISDIPFEDIVLLMQSARFPLALRFRRPERVRRGSSFSAIKLGFFDSSPKKPAESVPETSGGSIFGDLAGTMKVSS